MSKTTMAVFIIGILLLIYGYLCRFLSIHFFWDSKHFGWFGIISGMLLLLIDVRMMRLRRKKNIFFVRLMVAIIVINLAIEVSATVLLRSSALYSGVIESLKKDDGLKYETGDIKGFGFIPGLDLMNVLKSQWSGSLTFLITVRGEKAYRDVEVKVDNLSNPQWAVWSVNTISYP